VLFAFLADLQSGPFFIPDVDDPAVYVLRADDD
jgi:hypothetical protein